MRKGLSRARTQELVKQTHRVKRRMHRFSNASIGKSAADQSAGLDAGEVGRQADVRSISILT